MFVLQIAEYHKSMSLRVSIKAGCQVDLDSRRQHCDRETSKRQIVFTDTHATLKETGTAPIEGTNNTRITERGCGDRMVVPCDSADENPHFSITINDYYHVIYIYVYICIMSLAQQFALVNCYFLTSPLNLCMFLVEYSFDS